MLGGNLCDFIEVLTDDECRLLVAFARAELKIEGVHAGSVYFISRGALSDAIEKVRTQLNNPRGFTWSKFYVGCGDLIRDMNGFHMLWEIQRKVERRSYHVNITGKKRKYALTLFKDGEVFATYRCKTIDIARFRGSKWATGKGIEDVQERGSVIQSAAA